MCHKCHSNRTQPRQYPGLDPAPDLAPQRAAAIAAYFSTNLTAIPGHLVSLITDFARADPLYQLPTELFLKLLMLPDMRHSGEDRKSRLINEAERFKPMRLCVDLSSTAISLSYHTYTNAPAPYWLEERVRYLIKNHLPRLERITTPRLGEARPGESIFAESKPWNPPGAAPTVVAIRNESVPGVAVICTPLGEIDHSISSEEAPSYAVKVDLTTGGPYDQASFDSRIHLQWCIR